MSEAVHMCESCDEAPAELCITVSRRGGEVLDQTELCRECARPGLHALYLSTGEAPGKED